MTHQPPFVAIVDDEESVRRAMSRLIRSAGIDVVTFSSGTEFLDSVHSRVPSCIVLDLHMPMVNGFDVYEQLRRWRMDTPVILITGHDTPETRARAEAAGMAAYFRKPVDDTTLLEAIGHCTNTPISNT